MVGFNRVPRLTITARETSVCSVPIAPHATKAGILTEAVRLFGDQGYQATSMRDIANAVGLLPGSLYAHIDDKEGLLGEIVASGIDRYLAAGESIAAAGGPPDMRLRRLIKAHVEIIAENIPLTQVVFHQWKHLARPRRQEVVEKRRRYEALFTQVLDDGVESGVFSRALNPRVAVLAILGILNWVPEWLSPEANDVGDHVADVVLHGLKTPTR
jgi:TetR/AcrR family transcriptional regulator, cholesterol catabolism regulator